MLCAIWLGTLLVRHLVGILYLFGILYRVVELPWYFVGILCRVVELPWYLVGEVPCWYLVPCC